MSTAHSVIAHIDQSERLSDWLEDIPADASLDVLEAALAREEMRLASVQAQAHVIKTALRTAARTGKEKRHA